MNNSVGGEDGRAEPQPGNSEALIRSAIAPVRVRAAFFERPNACD
jgi:hypothetical protein